MPSVVDELAALPLFKSVPPGALRASAPAWRLQALAPGERLWAQGAPADSLGVVVYGELGARIDGMDMSRALPGEVVGEVSAFFVDCPRSASLIARKPSQVVLLGVDGLRNLRWQRSPVYDTLLEHGLKAMVRRVQQSNDRLARLAQGSQAAPERKEPSALVKLWRTFRPGRPKDPPPALEPLLRNLPGLREVDPEVIAGLQGAFELRAIEEGEVLFLEGEPGDAAWLVGEGQVDVLRTVRGDRAERLSVMSAGDLLGINTLIVRGPRTASCVAATPTWAWRLGFDACGQLKGDARLWWRECLLSAMATQLRLANLGLQRALAASPDASRPPPPPAPPGDDDFTSLLRASGFLEGLPANEKALEEIRFVTDEDARRNPRTRPK